jgi:lipopolysaccharide transport system ATP-binding protein
VSGLAIAVDGLGKRFRIGAAQPQGSLREALAEGLRSRLWSRDGRKPDETIWALRDVGFEVPRGQVLGIVGRNGAGKSTLLKILSRITAPTEGRVTLRGRVGSLLEVGTGFHPELTGRENIALNGAILGMRQAQIRARFDEIVAFSGVERFLDTPVKRYSTGMRVRLAFAVAAHLEPEILLVDEVLAVGDASFQRKCLGKMGEVAEGGRTVLFVSHNMAAVRHLCDRALLLGDGSVEIDGEVESVVRSYLATPDPSDAPRGTSDDALDGGAELHGVTLHDASGGSIGRVLCGESFSFALDLQLKQPAKRADVHIALSAMPGENLSLLSSTVAGSDLALPGERCRVLCRVDDLPLVPGSYDVAVKVLADGETLFFRRQAARLSVEPGDFFGSGRLPPAPWAGQVLLKQAWTLEA